MTFFDGAQGRRDLTVLRLLQLFDSQFPIGAFAHSGGLETYAGAGLDLAGLRELLSNEIALGWSRGDLAAVRLAWRESAEPDASERLASLARRVDAYKVIRSVRETSLRLGTRTLSLVRRLYPDATTSMDVRPPHYPVVVGAVGRRLDLPLRELLLAFGQSTIAASLAAATRCMPVSPAQAQALLVDLQPALAEAVERSLGDGDETMFTCTPALDIRNHEQAFLHTRLFQS
ncbi:MAG: urease accessory protein UreF [Vicinamibacterales bacterium]